MSDAQLNEDKCDAPKETIHLAAYDNDWASVLRLSTQKPGVYTIEDLAHAAKCGELDDVTRILEYGIPVDAIDATSEYEHGWPALFHACWWNRIPVVEKLIKAGANVNYLTRDGGTPLYTAIQMGRVRVVKLLISSGADVNLVSDKSSTSPLCSAVERGDKGIVELLISSGANVNFLPKDPRTALSRTLDDDERKLDIAVCLLRANANPNVAGDKGMTPLMTFVDSLECVRLCLQNGADVDPVDELGETALIKASHFPDTVELLVHNGADVEKRDMDGNTPLILASMYGIRRSARILLRAGADINARNNDGQTALMRAALWGDDYLVRDFIAAGADLDMRDNDGKTALMYSQSDRTSYVLARAMADKAFHNNQ